jgi:hypothetical protein
LRNRIEDQVANVKVEQGEESKRVRTNFQIYNRFPIAKVKQVSQGEGSRKTKGRFETSR